MKRFDFLTIGGAVFGMGLVLWGIMMGSSLSAFINWPGLMITLGGSFGAMMINYQMDQVRQVMKITAQVIFNKNENISSLEQIFVNLAQKARREGLLALEDQLEEIEDPFLRNGLQMVIDGFEPDSIRDIMETEIHTLTQRHNMGQNLYRTWGSLTPAFGMIGTLIGLVQMLSALNNPDAIGPGMAVALLTTFYGVLMANLILNPIAGKLAIRSEVEVSRKEAIIDAVLSLQAGVNPRILQEKLKAYLSPQERENLSGKKTDQERASEEEAMA
ncbi:MAG: MotA/TolQ/ExbB proton channel family protein [Bacillota bacterium]|nr:MotA/TolQ/ExbB proton channel family protein [Bacillota bacterium]